MLCEAEFSRLTSETAKLAQVGHVELFQPCPNTTVGKFSVITPAHRMKVTYTNGQVNVDANDGRVAWQMSVEEALRFVRAILKLDFLSGFLQRLHAK